MTVDEIEQVLVIHVSQKLINLDIHSQNVVCEWVVKIRVNWMDDYWCYCSVTHWVRDQKECCYGGIFSVVSVCFTGKNAVFCSVWFSDSAERMFDCLVAIPYNAHNATVDRHHFYPCVLDVASLASVVYFLPTFLASWPHEWVCGLDWPTDLRQLYLPGWRRWLGLTMVSHHEAQLHGMSKGWVVDVPGAQTEADRLAVKQRQTKR